MSGGRTSVGHLATAAANLSIGRVRVGMMIVSVRISL